MFAQLLYRKSIIPKLSGTIWGIKAANHRIATLGLVYTIQLQNTVRKY